MRELPIGGTPDIARGTRMRAQERHQVAVLTSLAIAEPEGSCALATLTFAF